MSSFYAKELDRPQNDAEADEDDHDPDGKMRELPIPYQNISTMSDSEEEAKLLFERNRRLVSPPSRYENDNDDEESED